jgi:NAD(P)H-hydrate epimerase
MVRLTRAQVREVDRRAIEEYHIPGIVLMENAARAVAQAAISMAGDPYFLIVCGGGNNGGDGLAVARHLHNQGATVHLFLTHPPGKYSGDALTNWRICEAMRLPVLDGPEQIKGKDWDLVIDAIFGTGLSQAPRQPEEAIIQHLNVSRRRILAIDLPSGLDCDTGLKLGSACVRAEKTVTFVAEKAGFANPESKQYTGEVIVGDIGCPRELIEEVARTVG